MSVIERIITEFANDHEKRSFAKTLYYVREMLRDRKYKTIPELDIDTINFTTRSANNFIAYKGESEGNGEKTHIYYVNNPTLGTDEARNLVSYINDHSDQGVTSDRFIAIVHSKISPVAQGFLREMAIQKKRVDVFLDCDLQYNITKHDYVPEHIICSETTKQTVLKEYGATPAKMPKILTTDPMVKWLGAHQGQMIKIIRESEFSKVYAETRLGDVSYAIVIESHSKQKGMKKKKK